MIFCNYACSKENSLEKAHPSEGLYEKLETAFQLSSTKQLDQFFIDWNTSVSSNIADSIEQDDITKTIYEIYRELYSPLDLTRIGNWKWGNSSNSNSKYFMVQNRIYYAVVEKELLDSLHYKETYNSINDFRPPLNLPKNKILYLLPKYEEALNKFLGTEETEDNKKRHEFVRPCIPILYSHWGWYWRLATPPEISFILLSTDKTAAKVVFNIAFNGGEATLEKNGNMWVVTKSEIIMKE